jgi:hypothetical protein
MSTGKITIIGVSIMVALAIFAAILVPSIDKKECEVVVDTLAVEVDTLVLDTLK